MSVHDLLEGFRKTNVVPRIAFYGRHSTDKQTMLMQLDAVNRFCLEHGYDFQNVAKYEDKDVSATKKGIAERPKLLEMLSDAAKGLYDFIIVYSDSRLARDPIEHAQIRSLLKIPVILCNTGGLYNPEYGELLTLLIRDGSSKFEVDQTAERTRDTFIYKVKSGKAVNGTLPYGYVHERGADQYRVESMRHRRELESLFAWYAQGEGFVAIAHKLQWWRADGSTPNKERVKSIVLNPFYAGYRSMNKVAKKSRMTYLPREEWILGADQRIETVLSLDEWEHCYELYLKKKDGSISPKAFKTRFLLSGLAVCGTCLTGGDRQLMRGENHLRRRQDFTQTGSRYYECSHCGFRVDADLLHRTIIDDVLHKWVARTEIEWAEIKARIQRSVEAERSILLEAVQELDVLASAKKSDLESADTKQKRLSPADDHDMWSILDTYKGIVGGQVEGIVFEREELYRDARELETWLDDGEMLRKIRLQLLNEQELRRLILALITEVTVNQDYATDTINLDIVGKIGAV